MHLYIHTYINTPKSLHFPDSTKMQLPFTLTNKTSKLPERRNSGGSWSRRFRTASRRLPSAPGSGLARAWRRGGTGS